MYFALGLLVVVFLFGTNVNGGQRWLYIGSYSLQPAEIFKFATILYLGAMFVKFSERERSTAQWVVSATPIVLGLLLIMAEHDIGTAAVYTAIIFTFLFMAGFPRKKLLTGIGAGAVVFLVALVVFRHTRERIQFWISGFHDAQNHGYQMHQSWIALGSGGPFGHFYGHSIAKWGYLPNPHTDFILSVLGEEFGFIGTLAVLTLFLFFLRYASQIARESRVSVYSAMAYGVIGWIMVETTINVASVIGIFPVTGVPLPFFSYGGTALVMEMAAMGLLFNISGDRSERDHRSLARIQTPSDQRRRRLMRDAAMYGRE
jgi:cell division protein FtsW